MRSIDAVRPRAHRSNAAHSEPTPPIEKVEALYDNLVTWYGEGQDPQTRAATNLLMIALLKLKEHGGVGWQALVEDYVLMLNNDPERYRRVLNANRGESKAGEPVG